MIILLHLIAVILKPLHTFFIGIRLHWFLLLINRNLIILLICLSSYLLIKRIHNRLMQFDNLILDKGKNVYIEFIKNITFIKSMLHIVLIFWFISFIFSSTDLILSYYRFKIPSLFLLCQFLPYVYIFYKASTIFYKWIKGD